METEGLAEQLLLGLWFLLLVVPVDRATTQEATVALVVLVAELENTTQQADQGASAAAVVALATKEMEVRAALTAAVVALVGKTHHLTVLPVPVVLMEETVVSLVPQAVEVPLHRELHFFDFQEKHSILQVLAEAVALTPLVTCTPAAVVADTAELVAPVATAAVAEVDFYLLAVTMPVEAAVLEEEGAMETRRQETLPEAVEAAVSFLPVATAVLAPLAIVAVEVAPMKISTMLVLALLASAY